MAAPSYSREVCAELLARLRALPLASPYRRRRYEAGDVLDLELTTAWPERTGRGCFTIEKFAGGGYAGQVYRCRLESLSLDGTGPDAGGLTPGQVVAVKILVPPVRSAVWFRNLIYRIGFQSAFSPQTNAAACRSGLLWPRLLRIAAKDVFGREDAIATTYASFYDAELRAWGEVREWVEGRTWRLEADQRLSLRRQWRTIDPAASGSPEYIAKRQFMDRLVTMLHRMGAPELARQYAWWTMKSQPNVLRRTAAGDAPGDGLCAVDFRAGLALLPFLPMSPADVVLIGRGLRRGSLVQFDRCDFAQLRRYFEGGQSAGAGDCGALIDAMERYDACYRASQPDITHQGIRLLCDRALRASVRRGLADGYYSAGLVDAAFRDRLAEGKGFARFYLLGALPLIGRLARRLWGDAGWRRHVAGLFSSWSYLRCSGRASAAAAALTWHRGGRISAGHAMRVADHVGIFWLERLTVGWMPRPLHRVGVDPMLPLRAIGRGWRYMRRFLSDPAFRAAWLRDQIEDGYREGMLTDTERAVILTRIDDPFIARYLKSVGVHLATLPATQIVSLIVGAIVAARVYTASGSAEQAGLAFGVTLAAFQLVPVSPGSLLRGSYVVYLMIRERNWRDYVVAAPLSFVKYIGYLAFPLQMTTAYPELAQYLAGRWATGAARIVPVFGERGGLFEHMVFDLSFNVMHAAGRFLSRRVRLLLTGWLVLGSILLALVLSRRTDWLLLYELAAVGGSVERAGALRSLMNVVLAYIGVFLLPRVLFYPVLRRRPKRGGNSHHGGHALRR